MEGSKAAILLFMLALAACAQSEEVTIGAVLSLTGPAAAYGEAAREGIDLAAERLEEQGISVSIVYEDDATNPQQSATAFQKIVHADDVDAVIGGTWDFTYNAIAPLAEENRRALITIQNPPMEGLARNPYTYTMLPPLETMMGSLEFYLSQQGFARFGIVRFSSSWGEATERGLGAIAENLGAQVVVSETYTSIGGNDFRTTVEKLKRERAQAVFIDMVGADIAGFLRSARELGLDAQILSYQTIEDYTQSGLPQDLVDGVVYFDFSQTEPGEFAELFEERYGHAPQHNADKAYDAVMALAQALRNVPAQEVPSYLDAHTFSTINGEFAFANHTLEAHEVLVKRIANGSIEVIGQVTIGS